MLILKYYWLLTCHSAVVIKLAETTLLKHLVAVLYHYYFSLTCSASSNDGLFYFLKKWKLYNDESAREFLHPQISFAIQEIDSF